MSSAAQPAHMILTHFAKGKKDGRLQLFPAEFLSYERRKENDYAKSSVTAAPLEQIPEMFPISIAISNTGNEYRKKYSNRYFFR